MREYLLGSRKMWEIEEYESWWRVIFKDHTYCSVLSTVFLHSNGDVKLNKNLTTCHPIFKIENITCKKF